MTLTSKPKRTSIKRYIITHFWNALAIFKYRVAKPKIIQAPRRYERRIRMVPMGEVFPKIPLRSVKVEDHVPADELRFGRIPLPLFWWFHCLQAWLQRVLPPVIPGTAAMDDDPDRALRKAYDADRRRFRAPRFPELYGRLHHKQRLAELAVRGPYFNYLRAVGDGTFEWDLRDMARFEHRDDLVNLGVRVQFLVDHSLDRLTVAGIETSDGRTFVPTDPDWEDAQRLALCSITTHCSLFRHFAWVHLAAGAPFAVSVRNNLPCDHPLRLLFHPHIYRTHDSNRNVSLVQMNPGGDFEMFSYTRRGLLDAFESFYEAYDAVNLDPRSHAKTYGYARAGFDTPSLDNHCRLFDVFHRHTERYIKAHYADDAGLAADEHVVAWWKELDELIPGGIQREFGAHISIASVSRLAAGLIYTVTTGHEQLGTLLWDYQAWPEVQPVRVYKDGRRLPADLYQRLMNANYNLNVRRTRLVQDFGYLASDERGREAFRKFEEELLSLEQQWMNAHCTRRPWWIYPSMLEANMNA